MHFPDHPFWDFAIRVYGTAGVPPACLNLQERHSIDVNLMLFCLWFGHSGRGVMTKTEMDAALASSENWHHVVVKGLRHVRRTLKEGFPAVDQRLCQALRAEVQKTEINAEHLEQLILVEAVPRPDSRVDAPEDVRARDAVENVRLYVNAAGGKLDSRDSGDFGHILGAAFHGLAPAAVAEAAGILAGT